MRNIYYFRIINHVTNKKPTSSVFHKLKHLSQILTSLSIYNSNTLISITYTLCLKIFKPEQMTNKLYNILINFI